jgi:hypothetical protein
MEVFKIPNTAKVQRVIPKNTFDAYVNTKQKKLFTDLIARITWLYKLSPDTVNLEAKGISEIQIFKVELKVNEEVQPVLDAIDKSIPYRIIFIVEYEGKVFLSTSVKHLHPVNVDNAVIDWTFKSSWFLPSANKYRIHLRKDLDAVYEDFCNQLSGNPNMVNRSLQELVEYSKQLHTLKKEIAQLQKSIRNSKQFNSKVELNLLLQRRTRELKALMSE